MRAILFRTIERFELTAGRGRGRPKGRPGLFIGTDTGVVGVPGYGEAINQELRTNQCECFRGGHRRRSRAEERRQESRSFTLTAYTAACEPGRGTINLVIENRSPVFRKVNHDRVCPGRNEFVSSVPCNEQPASGRDKK